MMKIFHNPRCKKSRAGLHYLQEKTADVEVIEYLKNPFTIESFKNVLMLLNKKPVDMIRTQEEQYKKELKGRDFTDDEWVKIMVENPKLIQRPIVVGKHKAILAQPPENIDELI